MLKIDPAQILSGAEWSCSAARAVKMQRLTRIEAIWSGVHVAGVSQRRWSMWKLRGLCVCVCALAFAPMYVCLFNSSFLPCYCQIHIDIPRMSPESLVLQPKVTEVRVTEQTELGTQLNPPCSVSNKPHSQTHTHTLTDRPPVRFGLFQLAKLQPLSCIRLAPL